MGAIQRYIVGETLKVFAAALLFTLALLTLGGGAREGIQQGLPPQLVVRTLPYLVPEMLRFTVPGCLLFAVCSVFSRMAAANELVAVKSLGISPLRVVWPVLALAYLLSIATYAAYDACAVWARPGLRRLVAESVDQIALGFLSARGSFDAHGLSIVVREVKDGRLQGPVISVRSRANLPALTLVAREARLHSDRQTGILQIDCINGQIDVAGRGAFRFPDHFTHRMPIHPAEDHPENQLSPAALASSQLRPQIARERGLIADLNAKLADPANEDPQQRAAWEDERKQRFERLHRLRAEGPRRLANGFGCLSFVMLGIPIAMRSRSADAMSVFFVCFLPVLLVYYPLLVMGENLARAGTVPQLSVWLADAALLTAGVLLLRVILKR